MFVVICPKCDKKLHLPDTTRGKHVRCAGCQAIVLASTEPTTEAQPPPRKVAPPPLPVLDSPGLEDESVEEPVEEQNPVMDAVPGLLCASCEAAAVMEMPLDANSRRPGYICAMCRTVMRPAGSMGNYYAAAILGAVFVLLGIGLAIVAFEAKRARGQMVGGGAALAVLGGFVAGWAIMQARLPVPIGAKASSSRLGFWIAVLLIVLLLAGGGIFGLVYVKKEM